MRNCFLLQFFCTYKSIQHFLFHVFIYIRVMPQHDQKRSNDNKAARSYAAASEAWTCSNATATGTETKESSYFQNASFREGSPARYPCFYNQLLNDLWEGVIQAPSIVTSQVRCMHLSPLGLALPSYQVVNHFFKPRLSNSTTVC